MLFHTCPLSVVDFCFYFTKSSAYCQDFLTECRHRYIICTHVVKSGLFFAFRRFLRLTSRAFWDIIYCCRMGPQWFRRGFCDTISVAGRIIPINCPTLKNKRQQSSCSGCLIRQCRKTAVLPVAPGWPRPGLQRHAAVTVHRRFAIEPIMHKMATLPQSLSADAAKGEF